jgi:hypothetical protein
MHPSGHMRATACHERLAEPFSCVYIINSLNEIGRARASMMLMDLAVPDSSLGSVL